MTTNDQLTLAIDQGGQSSRVAVYTRSGEQLYCFSAACATTHRNVEGCEYIEQDPQEILQGILDCLAKIQSVMGANLHNIKAAGFAGQGSSLLCWDKTTGEALSPVLSWQDIRGQQYLEHLGLTNAHAQQITGLRVSPHYGASKIKWCLEHNEKVRAAKNNDSLTIGPIVSFIFWHLTRTKSVSLLPTSFSTAYVDPGHAQRTLLWNLQKNNWDDELLNVFSIPKNILPDVLYHNSNFGYLDLAGHKIPFTSSARDQGASLFARGEPDKTACYVNIGTGAFIQRITDNLQAPAGLLVSPLWLPEPQEEIEPSSPVCYLEAFSEHSSRRNLYAWEATVNGAASAISFIQQQTGLQISPAEINAALKLEPVTECYFLNALGGLSAPYWRTDLQSCFSGGINAHEKVLAWLESIIFQIVINLELMASQSPIEKIYISGGLSNADALCQSIADLTQTKVIRSKNADATLQGIANMANGLSPSWQPEMPDTIFHSLKKPSLKHRFNVWQGAMSAWLSS